jgi:hypothetical protein
LIGGNPLLAPLGDYGGLTQTMALLLGSPAIDAGVAVPGVTTDQRGTERDDHPDIGAFEVRAATHFAVAGQTLSPLTVKVEDQFGNVVTSSSTSVALAIASGPSGAILGGTTTEAAVNGIATFSDLTLSKYGSYQLAASTPSLMGSTSTAFNITAVALETDPVDPSKTALFVGGTTGADTITIKPADANGTLSAKIGTTNLGNFQPKEPKFNTGHASVGRHGMGATTATGWRRGVQTSPFLRKRLRLASSESRHSFQPPGLPNCCSSATS